ETLPSSPGRCRTDDHKTARPRLPKSVQPWQNCPEPVRLVSASLQFSTRSNEVLDEAGRLPLTVPPCSRLLIWQTPARLPSRNLLSFCSLLSPERAGRDRAEPDGMISRMRGRARTPLRADAVRSQLT